MAKLISDKVGSRPKYITRDKEVLFIIMKGLFYQEDLTVLNINESNNQNSKYMKRKT